MLLGFHCVFGTYGFWLPNEPRGSWSEFVASWELLRFGKATTVRTRRSLARRPFDPRLREVMRNSLKFDPVEFTGEQAVIIAAAFAEAGYPIHALAIMPEHVHLVLGYTPQNIRKAVGHMKSNATKALRGTGHYRDHSPWAEHGWNVFLDSDEDVLRSIRYVEGNPMREGKRRQRWSCVVPYDGDEARRKRRG